MRQKVAIASAIGVCLVIGYLIYRGSSASPTPSASPDTAAFLSGLAPELDLAAALGQATSSTSSPAPSTLPEGFAEYRNTRYGFSLAYPKDFSMKEYDEGGGAETIVFQNPSEAKGLQIFIVPYAGTTISEAQFNKDEPSGARKNVVNTALDGVRAVTFTSVDATLGNTREIWVIYGGYLYEITTLKDVGAWFTPTVRSWRFLP